MDNANKLTVVIPFPITSALRDVLRNCTEVTQMRLLAVQSIHHHQLHCYACFAHVLLRPLLHGRDSIDGGRQY